MKSPAFIFDIIVSLWPVLVVVVGYLIGKQIERRHYASIRQREKQYQAIHVLSTRIPPNVSAEYEVSMVTGSVVVSADAFKTLVVTIRNFFGGNMRAYETLLERARREAILRLKENASRNGGTLVIGLRYYSNSITSGSYTPSIEMMAVGTLLKPKSP